MDPIETSTTSSTVAGDLTPTHSIIDPLAEQRCPTPPIETAPWPGNTYIIRHPASGRQITLIRGELSLEYHMGDQGGYHWKCVETDGWLGFCDPVHATYMGSDFRGGIQSKVMHHKSCEHFCARRHPGGGYILLRRDGHALMKMKVGEDGRKLVETKGEGTPWEFVKV
ncbi:hypothetical protein F5Y05DRAFT_385907 [Hypoxylon sp. FL0543]|nr:hypothetical protein F5Y05DRAFT_385907 [Hypoxylon sp. FL0543]